MSSRIVTYEVRDKQGKLVKTLQAPGGSQASDAIIQQYSGNPDFSYSLIAEPLQSDFGPNSETQYNQAATKYATDLNRITKEAQTRRDEEQQRIASSQQAYKNSIAQANAKIKLSAMVKNNPFVTNPNVAPFYHKQAVSYVKSAGKAQDDYVKSVDSYNSLTFQPIGFDQLPERGLEAPQYVAQKYPLENPKHGYNEKDPIPGYKIYQGKESDSTPEPKIPYNQSQQAKDDAKNLAVGQTGVITPEKPRTLNKAESLEYNKQLINAQLPYVAPDKFYKNPITGQTGSYALDERNKPSDVILGLKSGSSHSQKFIDAQNERRKLEASLPPALKAGTSLFGAPLKDGPQFKRTGDNFEAIKQKEAKQSEDIFKALFGNVQNPYFELGLPHDAPPQQVSAALERRSSKIKSNLIIGDQTETQSPQKNYSSIFDLGNGKQGYYDKTETKLTNFNTSEIKQAVNKAKEPSGAALLTWQTPQGKQQYKITNSNEAIRTIANETKKGASAFSIESIIPSVPSAYGDEQLYNIEIIKNGKVISRQTGLTQQEVDVLKKANEGQIVKQFDLKPTGIFGTFSDVKPKEKQEASLKVGGIFQGSLAAASENKNSSIPIFSIESERRIEPRPTTSDYFGNNPITRYIDETFELGKPINQRSNKKREIPGIDPDRFAGYSNRNIGEVTAPLVNRMLEASDTFRAQGQALQGKDSFSWQPGFLGIVPQYAPKEKTPLLETTQMKLLSGKPVDFSDENVRYSAYGDILTLAGEVYLFGKGVKIGQENIPKIPTKIKNTLIDSGIIKESLIDPKTGLYTPNRAQIKAQIKYEKSIGRITNQKLYAKQIKAEQDAWNALTPEQQTAKTLRLTYKKIRQQNTLYQELERALNQGSKYSIEKALQNPRIPYSVKKEVKDQLLSFRRTPQRKSYLDNPFSPTVINIGQGIGKIFGLPETPRFDYPKTKGGGTYSKPSFSEPNIQDSDIPNKGGDTILQPKAEVKPFTETTVELGIAKQVPKDELQKLLERIKTKNNPSSSLDNLFSKPRKTKYNLGVFTNTEVIAFPKQTPSTVTKTNQKTEQKTELSITPIVKTRRDSIQINLPKTRIKTIPIQITPTKQKEKTTTVTRLNTIITPIVGIKQTPIQSTKQTPIYKIITEQVPTFDIIEVPTDPIPNIPKPPREPPTPFEPLPLGDFGLIFPGFGFDFDGRKPKKKGKKKYLASSLDEMTPGVLAQAGVQTLRVGRTSKVYGIQDRAIRKARKKNTPRYKSVLDRPI